MAGASGSAKRRTGRWAGIDKVLRAEYGPLLCGIDEVGRGPLAGPVVACAIVMPAETRAIAGVDDSKQLSPAVREALAIQIRSRATAIGVGAASSREIDRINIYQATVLAMKRAISALGARPDHVVLDGRPIASLGVPHTAVVGGDGKCYTIACASIVAKVIRDRLMHRLAVRYPQYAWERNSGYATEFHLKAVDTVGLTPHHRRSFCNKQYALDIR